MKAYPTETEVLAGLVHLGQRVYMDRRAVLLYMQMLKKIITLPPGERGEGMRSECIGHAEDWFSKLDFHIKDHCYSLQEGKEATVVGLGVYTGDIPSSFEDPFEPELHLLREVEFLQVIN